MYFLASLLAHWSPSNRIMDFKNSIISSLVSCHIVAHIMTCGILSDGRISDVSVDESYSASGSLNVTESWNDMINSYKKLGKFSKDSIYALQYSWK